MKSRKLTHQTYRSTPFTQRPQSLVRAGNGAQSVVPGILVLFRGNLPDQNIYHSSRIRPSTCPHNWERGLLHHSDSPTRK